MSQPMKQRIPQLTLGWRLKMALGEISAQAMAEALGVSRATVSRWMADRGAPPRSIYLKEWALRTGVSYRWLCEGSVPPDPSSARPEGFEPPTFWLVANGGPTSTDRPTLRLVGEDADAEDVVAA